MDQSKTKRNYQRPIIDDIQNQLEDQFVVGFQDADQDDDGFDHGGGDDMELGFEDAPLADGFAANLNHIFDQKPAMMIQEMGRQFGVNRFQVNGG